ncbi:site-2 protease family protein [Sporosarcina sp. 179-K 3D1 HS]|uniref:site-2 protease family protein n=1 Tax=Sporosarcina sp. 179-K 3D1 HS TaxID=3232169 RepID=UPI0039A0DC5A
MRIRLHPVLLPFFLFLIVTGGIAMYALLFISLLFHEAGHLLAARFVGMRVRSCTIMPYGGELIIPDRQLAPKRDQLLVALGGPAATSFLLLVTVVIPFPGNEQMMFIQQALLYLNLLPILPLDGGQALCAMLEKEENRYQIRSYFLIHSIFFLFVASTILSVNLPETIPYLLLSLFLLLQNISAFRFRKYGMAYERLKRNRLT